VGRTCRTPGDCPAGADHGTRREEAQRGRGPSTGPRRRGAWAGSIQRGDLVHPRIGPHGWDQGTAEGRASSDQREFLAGVPRDHKPGGAEVYDDPGGSASFSLHHPGQRHHPGLLGRVEGAGSEWGPGRHDPAGPGAPAVRRQSSRQERPGLHRGANVQNSGRLPGGCRSWRQAARS